MCDGLIRLGLIHVSCFVMETVGDIHLDIDVCTELAYANSNKADLHNQTLQTCIPGDCKIADTYGILCAST